jgi:hypothetical protein
LFLALECALLDDFVHFKPLFDMLLKNVGFCYCLAGGAVMVGANNAYYGNCFLGVA